VRPQALRSTGLRLRLRTRTPAATSPRWMPYRARPHERRSFGSLRSAFDAVRGGSSRPECRHAFARGPHFKVESCPMNLRR